MKEVKKPSAVPYYGLAAVWLLYNLLFPMVTALHLLLCAALSAVVFLLLRKLFPPSVICVEEEPDTGDAALNEAIRQGRDYVRTFRRLNEAIPDGALSADLDGIERLTAEIFRQVEQNPDKLPAIRRLMSYYLPTTVKLVERYAETQHQAGLGNVDTMLERIRQMVTEVRGALERQLDTLYERDVIDITADIEVMEQMLACNGLATEKEETTWKI